MLQSNFHEFIRFHYSKILWTIIIAFYLMNGIMYLQAQSLTSDEGAFYNYATRYLKGDPARTYPVSDNSKMPVIVLNTLPRVVQQILNPQLKKGDEGVSDITNGRFVTLLVSVFTILLVYKWAEQLYGKNAGIFAAFLMSFCPNNIANAGLVTTDSYSVLCLVATMYYLWKFCKQSCNKDFILFSLSIAVSQLVKQSLFHLYVLVPILSIVYYFTKRPVLKYKSALKYLLIFIFINWIIINAGYYFKNSNLSLGSYHFISDLFQNVQRIFPSWLPVFFPKPFIDGLDMAKYYDQIGGGYEGISSFGKVTILGKSATGGSFWYYYFVSLFYKTPISILVFFGWSLLTLIRSGAIKKFIEREFFLILPVVYFLFILSFCYKTQCGIRHIIFIFPFVFVLSSRIIPFIKSTFSKFMIAALNFFLIISVLSYWKNYYPYTNEFIYDKKIAYAYVGASNLEFRQGNYFYRDYLKAHPEIQWAPEKPQTGIFLINTEDYLDIWNLHRYDWLSGIKPYAVVAYSGLLIRVGENDLPH